jgi:hypothetical protein
VRVNVVFVSLLAVLCLYAWWKGGAPEKIGAAIFAVGTILTHIAAAAPPFRYHSMEHGIFVVDVAAFLAFLLLALCAHRFWTLWVTGLLGVAIVGHVAMLLSPGVLPWAYRVALSVWSYPILALIGTGTMLHQKRLKRYGTDKSWSSFWRRPGPIAPEPEQTG